MVYILYGVRYKPMRTWPRYKYTRFSRRERAAAAAAAVASAVITDFRRSRTARTIESRTKYIVYYIIIITYGLVALLSLLLEFNCIYRYSRRHYKEFFFVLDSSPPTIKRSFSNFRENNERTLSKAHALQWMIITRIGRIHEMLPNWRVSYDLYNFHLARSRRSSGKNCL